MSEHDLHKGGTDDCQIIEELLSAFIDEELNATADTFVRHHLDSCTGCMKRLDELKATVEAINELPTEATPEHDLWPGIVAASSDGSLGAPVGVAQKGRWRMPKPWLLAAGLAALLAPAGVFAGMSLLRNDDEAVALQTRYLEADEAARAEDLVLDLNLEGIEEWAEAFAQEWEAAAEEWAEQWEQSYDYDYDTGAYDEAELDALLSALHDEDPDTRRTVARTLGEYENPRVVMALSRALMEDSDDEVRRWAAWALGEIESPEAVDALVSTLHSDSYGEARRWAAWALGEIESPQAVEDLSHALLNDSNWEVRRWSAWALGEIEDPGAAAALAAALQNDENADVRRWAIWALGELEHR